MELRDYARAVAARWAWLVVGGVVGLLLSAGLGATASHGYQSEIRLYVGASVVETPDDPAYAALVQDEILPSVAQLAGSTGVLTQVRETLQLTTPAAELAGEVTTATTTGSSLLEVTVTDPDSARAAALADAIGSAVQQQAAQLYPGTDGPLVTVQVASPADGAVAVSSSPSMMETLLMAFAGAGLAVVAAGLLELARPRIRNARDVGALTAVPVVLLPVAGPTRRRRGRVPSRSEQLLRLRSLLPSWAGDAPDRLVAVFGAGAGSLVADIRATRAASGRPGTDGPTLVPVTDPARLAADDGVIGAVVVADGSCTTRRSLRAAVEAVETSGRPLLGVVLDGVLPPGAGWRARLRAGLRGAGSWTAAARATADPRAGTRAAARGDRITAFLAVASLGYMRPLPMGVSTGLLAAVALLPLWAPTVRRFRGGSTLVVLAGLGLLSGTLLAWLSSRDHDVTRHEALWTTALVLTAVGGIGIILWARSLLTLTGIGVAYGLGALAEAVLILPAVPTDPWKFALSFPVIVIVLAVVMSWHRPLVTVAALGLLGLVSVVNDYRSAFAFCAVAAILVLWQSRPVSGRRRAPWWLTVPALAGLAATGYWGITQLLLSGALGSELQKRSLTQVRQSGSLLLGGRPEWTATWALMKDRPFGFGLGVVPTAHDIDVAKAGLAVVHIPTADSYLEHQLLSTGVHMHSIIADLWGALGPLGVVLGLALAGLMVHGLVDALGRRQASGLVCCLVPMALWFLAFGPLQDNMPTVTLVVGLLLLPRRPRPTREEPAARATAVPVSAGRALTAAAR